MSTLHITTCRDMTKCCSLQMGDVEFDHQFVCQPSNEGVCHLSAVVWLFWGFQD